MSDSAEIIASLKVDLALEHAAIIQYVIHGVLLRDVGLTDPVRKTAREEMWHFEWLSEAIRDRGGEPVLDRDEVFLPLSLAESMREDVAAEQRAISHYTKTLEVIGDSDRTLTRLIERIVADERHHHKTFEHLASQITEAGEGAVSAHPIMGPEDMAVVGPTIGTEYGTILQYLFNKYGCGDCDKGERYFEFAVDEMRHLSWVATFVPGLGDPVPPPVPFDSVRFPHSSGEAHDAADQIEMRAAEFYSAKVGEAKNEALRDELERALGHHEFHRAELENMS